jgi:hypothetical protein
MEPGTWLSNPVGTAVLSAPPYGSSAVACVPKTQANKPTVLLELGELIRVTLIRGSQSASGSGRLTYSSGAGRWRTSGGECFGTWSATRHAAYY